MGEFDRKLKIFQSPNANLKGVKNLNFYKFTQTYPKKER